jgi:hypothetical protein
MVLSIEPLLKAVFNNGSFKEPLLNDSAAFLSSRNLLIFCYYKPLLKKVINITMMPLNHLATNLIYNCYYMDVV